MRLTLRTMLAYLDDVLETGDADEIGKKVEESTFASDLSHRIRGSVRRLRLPAPEIDGSGVGADANSVSEYLDSTLPNDQVPEFEKVCLDSDVHLAEAASCHQILTLVLGEPANVDQAVRERMYRIGHRTVTETESPEKKQHDIDAPPLVDPPDGQDGPVAEDVQEVGIHEATDPSTPPVLRKPEIPEYLRESPRRRWWPLIVTGFVAAMITCIVLVLFRPMDPTHSAYVALFGDDPPAADIESLSGEESDDSDSSIDAGDDLEANAFEVASTEIADRASAVDVQNPAQSTERNDVDASAEATEPADTSSSRYSEPESDVEQAALVNGTTDGSEEPLGTDDIVDNERESDVTGETVQEAEEIEESGANPEAVQEPQPVEPAEVGRYIGEQVLVRLDVESESWQRLSPRGRGSTLFTGDVLLALPNFQPQIVGSGVQLTLGGGTLVRLDGSTEGEPRIHISYGRCLLEDLVGREGRTLLELAGRRVELKFVGTDSDYVAIEVEKILAPGTDPRDTLAHERVQIFPGPEGIIEITVDAEAPRTVAGGEAFQFIDGTDGEILSMEEFPPWIHGGDLQPIERTAARELESALVFDRPIELTLLEKSEASNSRRLEVRALAARCLTFFDQFDPLIVALNAPDHRIWWNSYFLAMRGAIARSPETAEALFTSLEKQRGGEAEELMHLVYGYSPDELSRGKAADLVNFLEHEKLDFRVLARENLQWITGLLDPYYRPEHPPVKRKRYVLNWRRRHEAGEIVYRDAPLDIPPRKDSTADTADN